MFIVCPSCSGPYRIAAEQIAPLVQIACPHCEYRVILDFEAANEPSLREAGHQFAQGFENAAAYASVYDHVTSKPDAQPRLGVTTVTGVTGVAAVAGATASVNSAATGSDTRSVSSSSHTPVNRPLQRPASTPNAAASASASSSQSAGAGASQGGSVRSAGTKTVLQVPSKKPVSMAPTDSPSISGQGPASAHSDSPSLSGAGGSSMRAGKNVDVVDEARPEEPSSRIPPHTPPTANVVSSGPIAVATPTARPDDVAAQSGAHAKPADTKAVDKPADAKPPAPTESGSSMTMYIIIALLIVAGVLVYVFVINK